MAAEVATFVAKIESYKTVLKSDAKDYEWMDGFNHGLDWAIRILTGDKSAS